MTDTEEMEDVGETESEGGACSEVSCDLMIENNPGVAASAEQRSQDELKEERRRCAELQPR